ncbi:MAG: hypothetical protein MZV70_39980 [Desulfobacterales bacterium]|nr:hypothetical protein [Desulfobacterales bacterium]
MNKRIVGNRFVALQLLVVSLAGCQTKPVGPGVAVSAGRHRLGRPSPRRSTRS